MAATPPFSWDDVANSPEFQSETPERQKQVELRYFQKFGKSEANKAFTKRGLPGLLGESMVQNESGGNPLARSKDDAFGLMQLMASAATDRKVNRYDPSENVEGGAEHFFTGYKQFGNLPQAVAAYHTGIYGVQKLVDAHGDRWREHLGPEGRDYVTNVMRDIENEVGPADLLTMSDANQQSVAKIAASLRKRKRAVSPPTTDVPPLMPPPPEPAPYSWDQVAQSQEYRSETPERQAEVRAKYVSLYGAAPLGQSAPAQSPFLGPLGTDPLMGPQAVPEVVPLIAATPPVPTQAVVQPPATTFPGTPPLSPFDPRMLQGAPNPNAEPPDPLTSITGLMGALLGASPQPQNYAMYPAPDLPVQPPLYFPAPQPNAWFPSVASPPSFVGPMPHPETSGFPYQHPLMGNQEQAAQQPATMIGPPRGEISREPLGELAPMVAQGGSQWLDMMANAGRLLGKQPEEIVRQSVAPGGAGFVGPPEGQGTEPWRSTVNRGAPLTGTTSPAEYITAAQKEGRAFTARNPKWFAASKESQDSAIRSAWTQGGTSAVTSLLAMGPGFVAGGVPGMAASGATLFGLSEYQTADDEITAFNKANPKDQIPPELATKIKLIRAGSEAGFEFASDLVGGKLLGLDKLAKVTSNAILRTALTPTVLKSVGKLMGTSAVETLSEMLTSGFQSYANRLASPETTPEQKQQMQESFNTGSPWPKLPPNFAANQPAPLEAAMQAGPPAFVASLLLGGLGVGFMHQHGKNTVDALADAEAEPARRMQAVHAVAESINDPTVRKQWQEAATATVQRGEAIPLDTTAEGAATQEQGKQRGDLPGALRGRGQQTETPPPGAETKGPKNEAGEKPPALQWVYDQLRTDDERRYVDATLTNPLDFQSRSEIQTPASISLTRLGEIHDLLREGMKAHQEGTPAKEPSSPKPMRTFEKGEWVVRFGKTEARFKNETAAKQFEQKLRGTDTKAPVTETPAPPTEAAPPTQQPPPQPATPEEGFVLGEDTAPQDAPFTMGEKPGAAGAQPPPPAQAVPEQGPEVPPTITPEDIHNLAKRQGIEFDAEKNPAFAQWSEQLTGESHLDKMSPAQLGQMRDALTRGEKPPTQKEDPPNGLQVPVQEDGPQAPEVTTQEGEVTPPVPSSAVSPTVGAESPTRISPAREAAPVAAPPVTPRPEKPIFSIRRHNNKVTSDPSANSHSDLLTRQNINPKDVKESGFLINGQFQAGTPHEQPPPAAPSTPPDLLTEARAVADNQSALTDVSRTAMQAALGPDTVIGGIPVRSMSDRLLAQEYVAREVSAPTEGEKPAPVGELPVSPTVPEAPPVSVPPPVTTPEPPAPPADPALLALADQAKRGKKATLTTPQRKAMRESLGTALPDGRRVNGLGDLSLALAYGERFAAPEQPAPAPVAATPKTPTAITPVTSVRTANTAIKQVDRLLVQRAREKAERDNNDYLITMWQGLNPEKLSPSDRDSLNDYLFGSEKGGTPEDLIRGIPVVEGEAPPAPPLTRPVQTQPPPTAPPATPQEQEREGAPADVPPTPEAAPTTSSKIRVYHGTPHGIHQFSLQKVGTGEGKQAFGYGLYFAENEGIARHYQTVLGKGQGKLYEVDLDVMPEHLLEWDKPLSAQSPYVVEKLTAAGIMQPNGKLSFSVVTPHEQPRSDSMQGYELYTQLRYSSQAYRHGVVAPDTSSSAMAVSSYLKKIGIPGMRYLDGPSRKAGKGTYNYLIWDESKIGKPIIRGASNAQNVPTITPPPTPTLTSLRQDFIDKFKVTPDQADAAIALIEARADAWATETGKPASEWITTHIAGIESGLTPGADALFQENQAWYVSGLRKIFESTAQEKMSPAQALALLKNAKAEEVKWTGITAWLQQQTKSVTKQEVLAFLDANAVRVEEVMKGGGNKEERNKVEAQIEKALSEREDLSARYDSYDQDDTSNERAAIYDQMLEKGQALERLNGELKRLDTQSASRAPQYASYTTPGGTPGSYRELVMTLPVADVKREAPVWRQGQRGQWAWFEGDQQVSGAFPSEEYAETARDTISSRPIKAKGFQSSHWAEPNVFAHLRWNEHTDSEGRRVFFLEEAQSDWSNVGRKYGYSEAVRAWNARKNEILAQFGQDSPEMNAHVNVAPVHAVADFPFAKNWHEVAIKRALHYAAAHGFDTFTWITGAQTAARYDLSKQISRVVYSPDQHLTAYNLKGTEVLSQQATPAELPDIIGKEVAEKLLALPPGNEYKPRELRGLDLQVGGEWATTLYDKVIPNFLSKYGKQWGAKVGEAKIIAWPHGYLVENRDGKWTVSDDDGIIHTAQTEEAAHQWADDRGATRVTVHSLPITDAMRDSVLAGQPLFQGTTQEIIDQIRTAKFITQRQALDILGGDSPPAFLDHVIAFLTEQKQRLLDGKMTVRDVAKAYVITMGSQGSDKRSLTALRANGMPQFDIPPMYQTTLQNGEPAARPEEAMAAWLMSPNGQKALDAIEQGNTDAKLWDEARRVRKAFGDDRLTKMGVFGPKGLARIADVLTQINAAKGDSQQIGDAVAQLAGIGIGKTGFMKHLIGMGDSPTIDAVEINGWLTGQGDIANIDTKAARLAREFKEASKTPRVMSALYGKIENRLNKLAQASGDVSTHVIHHWFWSKLKGIEEKHAGLYEAMRLAQRDATGAKGATTFLADGRALIHALQNAPDISTIVHELAHVFRRDLTGDDLQTVEKWAGVINGRWQRGNEETFARGFERYLSDGHAPTSKLKAIFQRFKTWLTEIYRTITGSAIDIQISPAVRAVFDRLLGGTGATRTAPTGDEIAKAYQDQEDATDIYTRHFVLPLARRIVKSQTWKTVSDLTVKDREGSTRLSASTNARELSKLVETGLVQRAWDKQGLTHYAVRGMAVPEWLSLSDDEAVFSKLPDKAHTDGAPRTDRPGTAPVETASPEVLPQAGAGGDVGGDAPAGSQTGTGAGSPADRPGQEPGAGMGAGPEETVPVRPAGRGLAKPPADVRLSLVIRDMGGIQPPRSLPGEVRMLRSTKEGSRLPPGVFRQGGNAFDDPAFLSQLEQAGFDIRSTEDLWAALETEASGQPIYPTTGQRATDALNEQANEEDDARAQADREMTIAYAQANNLTDVHQVVEQALEEGNQEILAAVNSIGGEFMDTEGNPIPFASTPQQMQTERVEAGNQGLLPGAPVREMPNAPIKAPGKSTAGMPMFNPQVATEELRQEKAQGGLFPTAPATAAPPPLPPDVGLAEETERETTQKLQGAQTGEPLAVWLWRSPQKGGQLNPVGAFYATTEESAARYGRGEGINLLTRDFLQLENPLVAGNKSEAARALGVRPGSLPMPEDAEDTDHYLDMALHEAADQEGYDSIVYTDGMDFYGEPEVHVFNPPALQDIPKFTVQGKTPAPAPATPAAPASFDAEFENSSTDDLMALLNEMKEERDAQEETAPEPTVSPEPAAPGQPAQPRTPRAPRAPRTPRPAAMPADAPAKPAASATDALKAAAKHGARAIDNAWAGLTELFGDKNKLGSGPVFDEETYRKAKPYFTQVLADVRASGESVREFIAIIMDRLTTKVTPYLQRFLADLKVTGLPPLAPTATQGAQSPQEDLTNVRSPGENPEPDRQDPNAQTPVGENPVSQDRPGETGGPRSPGGRVGESGRPTDGGVPLSDPGAAAGGERGDQPLHTEDGKFGPENDTAGDNDGAGSAPDRGAGAPLDRPGTQDAGLFADTTRPVDSAPEKRRQQQAAESIPVTVADADNIAATLPFLFPSQHADVLFAEQRLSLPEGYGVLFTNGTGTGKTFVGLGVIKRLVKQGKGNGLVLVPSQKIADDWINSGKELGLDLHLLDGLNDGGQDVAITTYANFAANTEMGKRAYDFVVADEAHTLLQNEANEPTGYLRRLRAITLHPDGISDRAELVHPELHEALVKAAVDLRSAHVAYASSPDQFRGEVFKADETFNTARRAWDEAVNQVRKEVAAAQGPTRPRALFLSATPFAYEKNVSWANGYLFEYPKEENRGGYNTASGFNKFMVQHFGYRMRYNKLTEPGTGVDRDLMQRQFNSHLRKQGVLSARMLDVDADYDRKFILMDSRVGQMIDDGMTWLREAEHGKFRGFYYAINNKFDFVSRSRLLEALKAEAAIPYIRQQHALGRKVVVFYDFNTGGGFNVFSLEGSKKTELRYTITQKGEYQYSGTTHFAESDPDVVSKPATGPGQSGTVSEYDLVAEFKNKRPDLFALDTVFPSPLQALQKAFPSALIYNGQVAAKKRIANIKAFNDDTNAGANLLLVQKAANAGWSGHDTSGKNPRVLINLGLPTAPTVAIQQEGRIYRVGQASDAMFRYFNTGTAWERFAFGSTISRRAATAENLAMGEQARGLRDSFIQGFDEADSEIPGPTDGKGGKEKDRGYASAITDFERAKTFYFGQQQKTKRTKSAEGTDYYATPEPLGQKMVGWANIRPNDSLLEPSAGHGAIARWFPERHSRTVIEPSMELGSRLGLITDANLINERFEDWHINNKRDVIVMNPPFGVGGKTAIEHLDLAYQHLNDGGRIVALIPEGPSADKRFDQWLYEEGVDENKREHKDAYLAGQIHLPTVTFERAGTQVKARVVIIDKVSNPQDAPNEQSSLDLSDAKTVNELFDRIEGIDGPARPEVTVQEQPKSGRVITQLATGDTQNNYEVRFPYNEQLVEELKQIPGRRWDGGQRVWLIPTSQREKLLEFAKKNQFNLGPLAEETNTLGALMRDRGAVLSNQRGAIIIPEAVVRKIRALIAKAQDVLSGKLPLTDQDRSAMREALGEDGRSLPQRALDFVREFIRRAQALLSNEQGAVHFRKPRSPRPVSPEVARVLSATAKPWGFRALKEALDNRIENILTAIQRERIVRDYPKLVNQLRSVKAAPSRARQMAVSQLVEIVAPLKQPEFEAFRQIVTYEDFIESARLGNMLPADPLTGKPLVLADIQAELSTLRNGMRTKLFPNVDAATVEAAVTRHHALMTEIGDDLVQRGKLSADDAREFYLPHKIIAYDQLMNQRFGLPQKLKDPYRSYTRQRKGSKRLIEMDYLQLMQDHLTKVHLDNAIDDFIDLVEKEYDVTATMTPVEKGKEFGPSHKAVAGTLYRDDTHIGAQFHPRPALYPVHTLTETLLQAAVAQSATAAEMAAHLQQKLDGEPDAFAVGKRHVAVLPIPIALRLAQLREPTGWFAMRGLIAGGTSLWKRMVMNTAGIPVQFNNIVGDLLNNYRDYGPSVGYYPAAIKTLGKELWAELRNLPAPPVSVLEQWAREEYVLGSAGLAHERGGVHSFYHDRRIGHLTGWRGLSSRYSPFTLIERTYQFANEVGKFAQFSAQMNRVQQGKSPQSQGLSVPRLEAAGLTPKEIAGKIAREGTTDYEDVAPFVDSMAGRRATLPFLTWVWSNASAWGKYVTAHPDDALVKFGIPMAALFLWNMFVHDDQEERNPDWIHWLPHLNTGMKTADGKDIVITFTTPVEAAARLIGFDRLPDRLRKIANGTLTIPEAAWGQAYDTAMGVPRTTVQLLNPFLQMTAELLANTETFSGRTIVPDRLKGTEEARTIQAKYALNKLLPPLAMWERTQRKDDATGNPLENFFFFGPGDWKRALGYRTLNPATEMRNRYYDAKEEALVKRQHALAQLESAYVETQILDTDAAYLAFAEQRRTLQQEFGLTGTEVKNRLTAPRVRFTIMKEQLKKTTDPAKRADLQAQLDQLGKVMLHDAMKSTPKALRGPLVEPYRKAQSAGEPTESPAP